MLTLTLIDNGDLTKKEMAFCKKNAGTIIKMLDAKWVLMEKSFRLTSYMAYEMKFVRINQPA